MSVLWTRCSLFFPCPSCVSLFGYFPVLVKFIDYSTPVLVFLNYFHVFISPEFSLSFCPSTRLICCASLDVCIWFDLLKEERLLFTRCLRCPSHTTTRDNAQEEAMWGGAPPYRNYFIGRASSGRDRNLPSNTESQLTMLSLLAGPLF